MKKQLFVIGVALLLFSVLLFGVGTASAADACAAPDFDAAPDDWLRHARTRRVPQ